MTLGRFGISISKRSVWPWCIRPFAKVAHIGRVVVWW